MTSTINFNTLKRRCSQSVQELFDEIGGGIGIKGRQYAFKDNGSNVLAVAHCDFVHGLGNHFSYTKLTDELLIFSPQLDDRLGVYTILDLLPQLDINVDILLTENEEMGRSTAEEFISNKEYNWMVSFDRRGTDAVTYEYFDFDKTIHKYFKVGLGTFSDITSLDVGCCGVNIGVGYHGEHTTRCYMVVEEYKTQMYRFYQMWKEEKDNRYPYDYVPYSYADDNYSPFYTGKYSKYNNLVKLEEEEECWDELYRDDGKIVDFPTSFPRAH